MREGREVKWTEFKTKGNPTPQRKETYASAVRKRSHEKVDTLFNKGRFSQADTSDPPAYKAGTNNRIKLVENGWDEYSVEDESLVKSVRKGKVVFDAKPTAATPAQQGPSALPKPTTSSTQTQPDPWKPDSTGQWYSAVSGQPINMEKFIVYPGKGKMIQEVLQEMECESHMAWRPKRSRKPVVVLDSKWSGWHEVDWNGEVIKTLRERGKPHPEDPESLAGTPLEDEYRVLRAKINEENKKKKLAQIADTEARARKLPPQDDEEFDGRRLISLVNSNDSMLVRAYLVFKFMERKNLVASSVTFNSLLTAALNACQVTVGFNIWRMMLSRGISPDVVTYNTLINLCVKGGHKDLAFKIFEEMRAYGFPGDEYSYNALLQADAKRAHQVVLADADKGMDIPDSILLRVKAELGSDEAFSLYNRIITGRYPPTTDDFNSVLLLCERRNDYKRALQIFNDMEMKNVPPNFLTYNTMMNMMAVNGQLEQLHKLQTLMHDRKVTTLVVLSTFNFCGRETSIVNGINIDLNVSIDVPCFDSEQDIALSHLTEQMIQYLEYNTDYKVNFKGLPTYTLMHLGNEYMQRSSLQYHCEKKSLAYLLLKHGKGIETTKPKEIPRVNVNARMCMDCHASFSAASKAFNVSLSCNDNNMLHVFEHGRDKSCADGWRNSDATNVPGSGQYGDEAVAPMPIGDIGDTK